jgi:hypothetical protein
MFFFSVLVVFGHYLMVNIAFHYWMALTTHPGVPPSDVILTEVIFNILDVTFAHFTIIRWLADIEFCTDIPYSSY